MAYKFFRTNCVIRAIALVATCFLLVYLVLKTSLYVTSLIVAVALVIQILSLIHYVEKVSRDLARFLSSIKYSDFSQSFSSGAKGSSFAELNTAFDEVISEFQRARAEKEEQYRYLQTVVHHVGLGLLAFDQDGEIDFINNAAKRLLKVTHLKNINSLSTLSTALVDTLRQLKPGEKALVKIENGGATLQLAIYVTEFKLPHRSITLVSLQDIESELAEQEMEAWQKLIRVLTHEIMNSVTPIASLASTVNALVTQSEATPDGQVVALSPESRKDIHQAAATIEKRSQGLLAFMDSYRNLTRIPKPNFQVFPITELFDRVTRLMNDQFDKNDIEVVALVEPQGLELTADKDLIEQVLINLLLNAINAVQQTQDKKIELCSRLDGQGRIVITVTDNGVGITDEIKDKIFTPFFTTKKDGSGIGLSLSRQILRLHKGSIGARSTLDGQTIFTLRF